MIIDEAALKTALETDARYDADVRSGNNRALLGLLDEDEGGQSKFLVVPIDEVMDAIGDGVRALTADKRATLQLFVSHTTVDFTRAATRAEVQEIFNSQNVVKARLQAIATKTRTYGEAFGGKVSLRNLWNVLPQISKSYMANYLARP